MSNGIMKMFVSYCHLDKDNDFCQLLCDELERHGVQSWRDRRQLRMGEAFHDVIMEAIRASDAFLVVMTPESMRSTYVLREVTYALQCREASGRPQLFPILLRKCTVPPELSASTWEDFTSDFAMPFRRLLASLRGEYSDIPEYGPVSGRRPPYLDTKENEAKRIYNAGVEAFQRGKLKEAVGFFDRAFELDASQFDAAYNAAVVSFELALKGDTDGLLASVAQRYEKVLRMVPTDIDAMVNLATIYTTDHDLRDFEAADKLLSQATTNAQDCALAWLHLGDLRLRQSGLQSILESGEAPSETLHRRRDLLLDARKFFERAFVLDASLALAFPAMAQAPAKISCLLAKLPDKE